MRLATATLALLAMTTSVQAHTCRINAVDADTNQPVIGMYADFVIHSVPSGNFETLDPALYSLSFDANTMTYLLEIADSAWASSNTMAATLRSSNYCGITTPDLIWSGCTINNSILMSINPGTCATTKGVVIGNAVNAEAPVSGVDYPSAHVQAARNAGFGQKMDALCKTGTCPLGLTCRPIDANKAPGGTIFETGWFRLNGAGTTMLFRTGSAPAISVTCGCKI